MKHLFPAVVLFAAVSVDSVAGERLPLEALVKQSAAIARVDVQFNMGAPATVTVKEWLRSATSKEPRDYGEWLGPCLPDAAFLETWVEHYPKYETRARWEQALLAQGYSAVVFLDLRLGGLAPVCETESLLVENWLDRGGGTPWLARLKHQLATNAPAIAPPPPAAGSRPAPTASTGRACAR